jgi:hypothetical protein
LLEVESGALWGPAPWKCRGEKDIVFEMEEKGSPILLNLRSDLLLGKGGLARCGKPETARTIHVALKVAAPNRRSQKSLKREIHLVDKLKPKVYQVIISVGLAFSGYLWIPSRLQIPWLYLRCTSVAPRNELCFCQENCRPVLPVPYWREAIRAASIHPKVFG